MVILCRQDAYFLFASTEWTFHSDRNEMVHSIPARMEHFIPAGMEWVIPFRPEGNGQFSSGRNEMSHSIPAGIKWVIPFRPKS